MRVAHALLLLLALARRTAYAQDDDMGGYGGGGEDGYGGGGGGYGGGGDEEPPPPPPADTTELTSVEEFEAFIDDADASVIAVFTAKEMKDPEAVMPSDWDEDEDGPWEAPTVENPALTSFNSISSSMYGWRFAYTMEPEVLAKLKAKGDALFLYRSPKFISKEYGDRPRERFPSTKLSESAVTNWLNAKAQPLVGKYSSQTSDRYKGAVLIIFMNLDFDKNQQSITYVLKRARKIAAPLKGKLSIAVASVSDLSYTLEDYGLTSKSAASDILMGIKSGEDHYGTAGQAFNAKTLQAFADSFLAGKLTPHVKPPYEAPEADEASDEDADEEKEEM